MPVGGNINYRGNIIAQYFLPIQLVWTESLHDVWEKEPLQLKEKVLRAFSEVSATWVKFTHM